MPTSIKRKPKTSKSLKTNLRKKTSTSVYSTLYSQNTNDIEELVNGIIPTQTREERTLKHKHWPLRPITNILFCSPPDQAMRNNMQSFHLRLPTLAWTILESALPPKMENPNVHLTQNVSQSFLATEQWINRCATDYPLVTIEHLCHE